MRADPLARQADTDLEFEVWSNAKPIKCMELLDQADYLALGGPCLGGEGDCMGVAKAPA